MKKLFPTIALLFIITIGYAQEIKLKKDIIYVNEVPTFSFSKKAMGNELHVYQLNTTDEIVSMIVDNNKTESKVDDSKRVVFTKQNMTVNSKDFRGKSFEDLLILLLGEKVLDLKGEINADNLKRFWSKFDQNNINQTNMH